MPNSFLDSDGVEHLAADIKALCDNTYTPITPTEVTGLSAGTNCSLGSYCYAYKIGPLCLVHLNLQITGSISSGATLVSGLPKAARRQCFAAAKSGGTQAYGMRINANATAITADGAISTTGYFDACLLYIMA